MANSQEISSLNSYLKYCKSKPRPRSDSYQSAIEDCLSVLAGQFDKIKARDSAYDSAMDKILKQRAKKKEKSKK